MVLGAYRQILRNQALKLSNIQTHIAELQAYQSVFFWIMRLCLVYYILKVCGWTLVCSICKSWNFKAYRNIDLVNHKQSKHEHPSVIENLKTSISNKVEKTESLNKNVSEIDNDNIIKNEKQNNLILNHVNSDIETLNSAHTFTFKCQYCGKTFDDNFILKEHVINHSGPNILHATCLDYEESDWETDEE